MVEHWLKTDLRKLPEIEKLSGQMFQQDSIKIGAEVTKDGAAVTLAGTVKAWVIKPDGTTVEITGEKSGNQAWVELPNSVYSQPGAIGIYLKLLDGSEVTTLGGVEGYIYKTM